MRSEKYELHLYWDDGVTIECRYFPTKKEAKQYADANGFTNYRVTLNSTYDDYIFSY